MGPFNNETRLFEEADWLFNGQWLEDEDGNLYIVPESRAIAEIEGPDGPTKDALNALCRRYGWAPEVDSRRLGLTEVPLVLRRFTPQDGYYHA